MTSLWSIEGEDVDVGYRNIRVAKLGQEQALKAALEAIWAKFEPYADAGFVKQFSQDPDAHFWEMYLGWSLLEAGKKLLTAAERKTAECLPDLCVIEGERRIWIEAIAPDEGSGENKVKGPKPINEGGGLEAAPVGQAQLRMTSALWDKSQKVKKYMAKGAMKDHDVKLIAIGVGRFGLYVSEDPPAIISAVFPIGEEYVTIDKATAEVIDWGYHHSPSIEKKGAKDPIPRTAFLEDTFAHVSGIIWSRASIGNYVRAARPLTFVHNPMATSKMDQGWSAWDKEYVTEKSGDGWVATNIKAKKTSQ